MDNNGVPLPYQYYTSKPPVLYRRFRKEIINLEKSYSVLGNDYVLMSLNINDFLLNYDFEHLYNEEGQMESLTYPITYYNKTRNIFYNFLLKDMGSYPFEPPTIMLNGRDILDIYKNNLFCKYEKYLIRNKRFQCCLLCSSVLNRKNWCVITNFKDVFTEILINLTDLKRAKEMYHMEKIIDKYLLGGNFKNYMMDFL